MLTIVIVMINRQSDIQVLSRLLKTFNGLSSARVNWSKSETLLLGKWAHGKPELPEGLIWGNLVLNTWECFWVMS